MELILKSILIHNFHLNGSQTIVNDFLKLGYVVYSPIDNWEGRISYYRKGAESLDSQFLEDVRLITYEEFITIKPEYVLMGCYEQYADFTCLAFDVSAKRVIHVAGNDQPIADGNMVISPDIITYEKYRLPKVLYLTEPVLRTDLVKNFYKSFHGEINSYIKDYEALWKRGYPLAQEFKTKYQNCNLFEDLEWKEAQERMVNGFFTLYFKDRDCWGNTVLESMAYGTPVIAYRPFIQDTSMGRLLLSNDNSIIVDSVEEALAKINDLTIEEYALMSARALIDVRRLTRTEDRLNKLRSLGL